MFAVSEECGLNDDLSKMKILSRAAGECER